MKKIIFTLKKAVSCYFIQNNVKIHHRPMETMHVKQHMFLHDQILMFLQLSKFKGNIKCVMKCKHNWHSVKQRGCSECYCPKARYLYIIQCLVVNMWSFVGICWLFSLGEYRLVILIPLSILKRGWNSALEGAL